MPINTDLNVSPYFDDYDEEKNYHRILFRPSVPVQARELTQLQTILQNQIERFGNWAFKNGDIVLGCNAAPKEVLPYVRLKNFASNSSSNSVPIDVTDYTNNVVISISSGLEAVVLYANNGFETNYPNTNVMYLRYLNTGTNGEKVFTNNELLQIRSVTTSGNTALANIYTYANVTVDTFATGNGHGIVVTDGVVYLNGNFVRVPQDTFGLVNNFSSYAGNAVVGFILSEEIITENDDETLVDNALGYPNENAPGSHRLKLTPKLVAYDESEDIEGFNPIGRYNFGSFVAKSGPSGANLYSIVGDVIAKRTYEESGNYIVNPFSVDTVTSTGDPNLAPKTSNNVLARIGTGIGYSLGQRVELIKSAYVDMRRGVDTKVYNDQAITFSYGNYFVLNEVAGNFDFDNAQTVQFYDAFQTAVSDRQFSTLNPTGNLIGTAKARCFSFNSGTPGTKNALYLLHVFDVTLNVGYNSNQIKSVFYNGSTKGVGDVYSTGLVNTGNKIQLYSFGFRGLKNLRDEDGTLNSLYDYRTKQSGNIDTSGEATFVLTGGNRQLPYGQVDALSDSEAVNFTVVVTSNVDSSTISGSLNVNTSTVNVVGSSTSFFNNFTPGDQIKVTSDSTTDLRTVVTIANSSFMTVDAPFSFTNNAAIYKKSFLKGKILPISRFAGGVSSYIQINDTDEFTIKTGLADNGVTLPSAIPIDVFFNVRKTKAVPSKKEIRKNRFVKINTANNPTGPWCLGFSDVHKITAIYANSGTVTVNSPDVTDNFSYDTGQLDTHYGLAYLYPKAGYNTADQNIIVQLDYFSANLSTGVGFFTVESYPIDDANSANTTAIQTKDIPLYVTENGDKVPLRDVIDFRIPCLSTANDTGTVDMSNTAQVTAAITYATTNPANTLTFNIDSLRGIETPAYGQNFQSDYTRYLSRKDLVMITPDNVLKIKEGTPSDFPQTPIMPENAMTLAVINIPPYPSLSSDQVDQFLRINQKSKSLIRDTSTAMSSSIMTSRRYTMKDIGRLDQRITNLEYYTQLSLLEKQAKDMTVTDASGLDRFKNGIFVDPFSDTSLGEVSNPEYSIAIDTRKGIARPRIIREVFKINISNAFDTVNDALFTGGRNFFIDETNFIQKTGRVITLPYDEIPFIIQPYATKYRSSALVAYAWNGKCVLIPSYDNRQDQNNTGSLNITIDNTNPWKEFAASPMGTVFGDWTTVSESTSNTVITGEVRNINFRANGMALSGGELNAISAGQGNRRLLAAVQAQAAAAGIDPNLVQGNLTVTYDGRALGTI
jgi:hypothetical protein